MRLSELIEEALSEIAIGVKSAKEKSRSVLAIAPGTLEDKFVAEITYIDFDVSVAVVETTENSSSKEKSLGGQLRVMSVGVDGKGSGKQSVNTSASAQTTHRISFKVPVCMAADFSGK
jgi:hypothetical protein